MSDGRLYVFEGEDGVGKSTLARALWSSLQSSGVRSELVTFPGTTVGSLGRHIYQLHHAPENFGVSAVHPTSLQLLHVAAHVDLIESLIKPAIRGGVSVVLDRYWWSTWVYGRFAGVPEQSLRRMIKIEKDYWGDI